MGAREESRFKVKVTKRRGAWVVDHYDFGKRRVKVFPTKRAADDFAADQARQRRQRIKPTLDAHVTLEGFVPTFLDRCRAMEIKPKTLERYEGALRVHIIPSLGAKRVRELDRPTVEAFLVAKKLGEESRQGQRGDQAAGRRKLASGTVLHLLMTLSAVMRAAVAVQLLVSNPLSGLTKDLRLTKRRRGDRQSIKALDQAQLVRFLSAARTEAPDVFPALAMMGLAGLRVGEAMALRWEHLDLEGRRIHVAEQLGGASTKDNEARDVEMGDALRGILLELQARRREDAFCRGRQVSPYALFPDFEDGTDRKAEQRVVKLIRRRMQRVLQRAGLAGHHTPHSLRHSFASILISKGKPIAYVQQALGHASIAMTVDVYGSWLPVEAPGAVNALAEGLSLALPVTFTPVTGNITDEGCAQVLEATGTFSPRPGPCPRSPCTCT